jgi:hypothetical protein
VKHAHNLKLWLGVILTLLFLTGCVPVQLLEPTATPTTVARAPTSTFTPTPSPTSTFTPTATATATETPTSTPSPVPPTATATPTFTPVPPTNTPIPPTATFTPTPVVITAWKGEYFNNTTLSPPPVLIRNDQTIDLALPSGVSPGPGVNSENWSARWTRTLNFPEGNYRFTITVDDGARLYVGDDLLIDKWFDQPATEYSANLYLNGDVPIQLDYYNHLGAAVIRLSWELVTSYPDWKGSYFANQDLTQPPVFQRDDPAIDFNFGRGSPRADIPVNHFSIRWARDVNFSPAGIYHFHAKSDDGVRLYIDGDLVINDWSNGEHVADVDVHMTAGSHHLRVDYYEYVSQAYIEFSYSLVPATNTPVPTAPRVPPTYTPAPATPTLFPTPPRVPPTNTPVPPLTPPKLRLRPSEGHLGEAFDVVGHHWPPNSTVDIYLLKPVQDPIIPAPTAEVVADGSGAFSVSVDVPKGDGWEAMADAIVRGSALNGQLYTGEQFHILPDLSSISFVGIPATEQRFALPNPTFLIFGSDQAWTQEFGSEQPPIQPPVKWKRDMVIGVFLGPQSSGAQVRVSSIVQRGATVSIWLADTGDLSAAARAKGGPISRTLVEVPYSDINHNYKGPAPELTFEFLDERGQVIAIGPQDNVQPVAAIFAQEGQPLLAPAPAIETPAELVAPAEAAAAQPPTRSRVLLVVLLVLVVAIVVVTVSTVGLILWRSNRRTRNG